MLTFPFVVILFIASQSFFALAGKAPTPHAIPGDPVPGQTCFDWNGRPLANNTQCPGSNSCCNYLHQCTDNHLCIQDGSDYYVNALCAVSPWENCSNICHYGTIGFLSPRFPVPVFTLNKPSRTILVLWILEEFSIAIIMFSWILIVAH